MSGNEAFCFVFIIFARYCAIFYMIKLFLLVLALLAVAMLLLAVNIIFKKDGSFRSEDVGASKAMRQRGIHCTRTQDRLAQADNSRLSDMMK